MAKKSKATGRAVKHVNKKLTKLAKRGKLKGKLKSRFNSIKSARASNAKSKQEQLQSDWLLSRETKEEEEEEVLPMDMLDDDFLPVQSSRKAKITASASWENQIRQFSAQKETENLKHLLPIKTKSGEIVPQFVEADLQSAQDAAEPAENIEQSDEIIDDLSQTKTTAEVFAQREKSLQEYKMQIASCCHLLLQEPERQIHKLKELLDLAAGNSINDLSRQTVQKLATASLSQVFLDIIPSYRIRERTETEQDQKVKKDTKQLIEFEESLLRYYKKYLQHLESWVSNGQTSGSDECLLAVKCLSSLLTTHAHFNFQMNIVALLVPLGQNRHSNVADLCCETIRTVFLEDKLGEVSLNIVRLINRKVKDNSDMGVKLLETLLSLKIKEVERKQTGHEKKAANKKKHKLIHMSKKEKKYQKQLNELEKELKETEAEQNRNVKLKMHTKIMDVVFTIYFRVLKRAPRSKLLVPVLEGISKFAHLINVDFFDDLLSSIHQLIEEAELKTMDSLHCIHTVFVILSGDGQALNIDPYRFYKLMYTLLPRIVMEQNKDIQLKQLTLCFRSLDIMINVRRKQVNLSRVAAFVKRLSLLVLALDARYALATIVAIRTYILAHQKLEYLVDEETGGSGEYLAKVEDPEHCNALAANIHELGLFQGHPDGLLNELCVHILAALPSQGSKRCPPNLNSVKCWDMLPKTPLNDQTAIISLSEIKKKMKKKLDSSDFCLQLQSIASEKLRNIK